MSYVYGDPREEAQQARREGTMANERAGPPVCPKCGCSALYSSVPFPKTAAPNELLPVECVSLACGWTGVHALIRTPR
jgi:hypothetical protein